MRIKLSESELYINQKKMEIQTKKRVIFHAVVDIGDSKPT